MQHGPITTFARLHFAPSGNSSCCFVSDFTPIEKWQQGSASDEVAVAVENDAADLKRLPSPPGIG
jgi:hypothetical protein